MEVLDDGPPGMIIGGVAVIALGFPRTTVDIDATVRAPLDDLDALVWRLGRAGIEPRMGAAIDFAKTNHVLLMKHRDSGVPIDISLAVLPFEEEAIAHRRMIDVGGLRLAIPRVDDLLVYKMVASRPSVTWRSCCCGTSIPSTCLAPGGSWRSSSPFSNAPTCS
ncbi:MAG: hypothetical protein ACREXK_07695 [Gammaproteobacteria bacterium]